MIYLISDTHFNHTNIITYESRPFASTAEMNDAIIKAWNSVVSKDDIVIHLGDVGLGRESSLKEIVPLLNGKKILICGNHDNKSKHFFLSCGFTEVFHTLTLTEQGKVIYLSHDPISRPGDGSPYDLHFYGHVHSKGIDSNYPTISHNGACLCVERWNYTPVSLDTLLTLCDQCPDINPNI